MNRVLSNLRTIAAMMMSVLLLMACVGPYREISPKDYEIPYQHYTNQDRDIQIAWQADILKLTRNKKYVRMERRNGIHLLVFKFKNLAEDEIRIPDDCIFLLEDTTELIPLNIEEAMEALIGSYASEIEVLKVAKSPFLKIGVIFSDEARMLKSHIDFALEMHKCYIDSRILAPGEELSGLLAIPLYENETFVIELASSNE